MSQHLFAPVLSPANVDQLIRENPRIRILDVRTPGEYSSVHIPGSYNVPLDTLGEHAREIRTNLTDPVILVCQSGQRAQKADRTLAAAGMTNLHILDGGMNAWVNTGFVVVRGKSKVSLERQVRIVAGALAATGGFLAAFVDPAFGFISAFIGSGLVFAGVTNTCGMAMLLARLPYNRSATCDVRDVVQTLARSAPPAR